MKKVQQDPSEAKKPATETVGGLEFKGCYSCGAPVVYCRAAGKRGGVVAVEIAPAGDGDVGITEDLFRARDPYAVELGNASSRYRLHGPRCPGPLTHSRFVGRKAK